MALMLLKFFLQCFNIGLEFCLSRYHLLIRLIDLRNFLIHVIKFLLFLNQLRFKISYLFLEFSFLIIMFLELEL